MNKVIVSISDAKDGKVTVKFETKFKPDAKDNVKVASINVANAIRSVLQSLETKEK